MKVTDEQMKRICALLKENGVYYSGLIYGEEHDYEDRMDGLYLDGDVTFDLMEKILEIAKEK